MERWQDCSQSLQEAVRQSLCLLSVIPPVWSAYLHALSVVVENFHLLSFVVGLLLIKFLPDQILVVGVVFQPVAAVAPVGNGSSSSSNRVISWTELYQAAAFVAPADVLRVIIRTPTANQLRDTVRKLSCVSVIHKSIHTYDNHTPCRRLHCFVAAHRCASFPANWCGFIYIWRWPY